MVYQIFPQQPQIQYPYNQYPYQQYPQYPMPTMNPQMLLGQINPVVQYGLAEAEVTSVKHAMTEVALITYLMGSGYDFATARRLVEQWEHGGFIKEKF